MDLSKYNKFYRDMLSKSTFKMTYIIHIQRNPNAKPLFQYTADELNQEFPLGNWSTGGDTDLSYTTDLYDSELGVEFLDEDLWLTTSNSIAFPIYAGHFVDSGGAEGGYDYGDDDEVDFQSGAMLHRVAVPLTNSDVQITTLRESANFDTGKYSISNTSIKLSNAEILGDRYKNKQNSRISHYLESLESNETLMNRPITIYIKSSSCKTILEDCPVLYYGRIRRLIIMLN